MLVVRQAIWPGALLASLVLHLLVPVLLLIWGSFNLFAFDLDALGERGGRQWAETIDLTTPKATGPQASLAVLASYAPAEGVKIDTPVYSARKAEEITPIDVPDAEVPEDTKIDTTDKMAELEDKPIEETEAEPLLPEQAERKFPDEQKQERKAEGEIGGMTEAAGADEEIAALEGGRDLTGAGIGAAADDSQGLFISGEEVRELLEGWTLVGTNGFADGSISAAGDVRKAAEWKVYYRKDGTLRAKFKRLAAGRPHGPIKVRSFVSEGKWWIRDNWLCQAIVRWFSGGTVCFEIRRDGNALAMYYAQCWGVTRCYRGRLGPEGVIRPGRKL